MERIFYIIIFLVGFNFGTAAQSRLPFNSYPAVKFIKYYPNPAVSVINFEFQKDYDRSLSFQIYNFIGKKILDLKSLPPKINIPLTDYYRGVYIYQLRDKSGKIIESGKFQVVK